MKCKFTALKDTSYKVFLDDLGDIGLESYSVTFGNDSNFKEGGTIYTIFQVENVNLKYSQSKIKQWESEKYELEEISLYF